MAEDTIMRSLSHPLRIDAGLSEMRQEPDTGAHVDQMLRQLLLTDPGERINRPDFGAGIRRMVFAPNSPAVASMAQTFVYQALSRWLPTVIKVEDVSVSAEQEKLLISVRYLVLQRGETRVLNEEVAF